MNTSIQSLVENYKELDSFLKSQGMLSESIEISNHYRKILLLSCASYYESKITTIIQAFVKTHTRDDRIFNFLNNKAIQRQYHTFFNWDSTNINNFLGLFGSDFKVNISKEIADNERLKICMRAFLAIGNERNKMVHENFLDYQLEKTFDELISLHSDAITFIEYLSSALS